MSQPTAASSTEPSPSDDRHADLLASVRARFQAVTAGPEAAAGKVHLFTTDVAELFPLFLSSLPPALHQRYTCSACRHFVERFGGVVRVGADGEAIPVMWSAEGTPDRYAPAIGALATAVARAPIRGVFLTQEKVWGVPETGPWRHFAVTPGEAFVFKPSAVTSRSQRVAEKLQDHETLLRGLAEFPLEVVNRARVLLTTESLHGSERVLGIATWLLTLHEQRAATANARARENLTWLAVAGAPAGFCHVRTTMIGTLLEDLVAGIPFADLKAKFDAKMGPLAYQRPVAPPTAGNLVQAEKIVEKLASAGSLERRFARLSDLQALWLPAARAGGGGPGKPGVFSHLKPAPAVKEVEAPPVTMTWDKFSRTVLATAEALEFFVPASNQAYVGMVTAKNPEAPPILQWDLEAKRNPVSWYFYVKGSTPARWNLKPGVYHRVTAVTLQPSMWEREKDFAHHGEKVIFVLEGARDTEYEKGAGFFPSFLRSEYHGIRATMEAYAQSAVVASKDEAEACGIGLQKGIGWDFTFRVTTKGGVRVSYRLDRWD